MNTGGRLAAFATGRVVAFTASYTPAAATAPDREATQQRGHRPEATTALPDAEPAGTVPAGLSLAQNGYVLSAVRAPRTPRERGTLSFTIADPAGEPLLDYASVHDKQLHLIAVRFDGARLTHVHPTLDRDAARGRHRGPGTPPAPTACSPTSNRQRRTARKSPSPAPSMWPARSSRHRWSPPGPSGFTSTSTSPTR